MSATRVWHSGAWIVSEIVGGYLVSRTYYGYTKREAVALFRAAKRRGDFA
jgi:hypothetical protein